MTTLYIIQIIKKIMVASLVVLSLWGALPCLAQPPIGLEALQSVEEWPAFRQGVQARQVSSSDQMGNEHDGDGFLYRQNDSLFVIFDQEGPGCVYRLWLQETNTSPTRTIKCYFDNELVPRINVSVQFLFSGFDYPLVPPLVGDGTVSSGGYYCYLPLPFNQHLKIALVGGNEPYQIGFHLYPPGTVVTTYTGAENPTTVQNQWQNTGDDPKNPTGNITVSGNLALTPGSTQVLFSRSGSGSITGIRLTPDVTVLSALESLRLRFYWDGVANPQVDCSLGSFFGSSLGLAEVAGLPLGIQGNEFYCYIPMPYWSNASLQIYNASPTGSVNIAYTLTHKTEPYSQENGYFCTKQQSFLESTPNQDLQFPQFSGHGHLIGLTETLLSTDPNFVSGDLRIYLDGIIQPVTLGTNFDADFNAGNGYTTGPFSRPVHGAPVVLTGLERKVCAYRFMLGDLLPFSSHISVRAEHGNRNSAQVEYGAVVYSYCRPEIALELTDQLNVGDVADEAAHNYSIQGGQTAQTHYYAYPGSYDEQFFSDPGRTHLGVSAFTATIAADNQGVRLVRRRDASIFPQSTLVNVNGDSVGIWWDSDYNYYKRWSDSYFEIPASFTQGQSQIELSLTWRGPREWSEYYYWVYSHTPPRLDVSPPAQVTNLSVQSVESGSQMKLQWNPASDDTGVDHYLVYRGSSPNIQPTPEYLIAQPNFNEYTDHSLLPGTYYYYRVSAVDYAGNVGLASAEIVQLTSSNYNFEAEYFSDITTSPDDPYATENMITYGESWSNQTQLLFGSDEVGDFLSVRLQIVRTDTYDVSGYFTRAPNAGILSLRIDDVPLGLPYDLYLPSLQRSPQHNFGTSPLAEGTHTITFVVAGKNSASSGYGLGLDNIIMTSHYLLPVLPGEPPPMPFNFTLAQNFPNPFNSQTRINFSLPKSGETTLTVYNLQGRQVALLSKGWRPAGNQTIEFQTEALSSGIYFLKLEQNEQIALRKLLHLK